MKENGLVIYNGVHGSSLGTWQLTQKGITEATQWDYKLKLQNNHPTQETLVKTIPAGDLIFTNSELEKEAKSPVDWQLRHTEFLEEIVREMIKSKQVTN